MASPDLAERIVSRLLEEWDIGLFEGGDFWIKADEERLSEQVRAVIAADSTAAPRNTPRKWPMSPAERHASIIESHDTNPDRAMIEAAAKAMIDYAGELDGDGGAAWSELSEKEKRNLFAVTAVGIHAAIAEWSSEGEPRPDDQ